MAQKAKLLKYESKGTKNSTKAKNKANKNQELLKLSAFAQEFHPSGPVVSESQDFVLPSSDYMLYDYNPYLATEEEYAVEYESERKPQRECDKLEGLDFSTFVVFANAKNVPLEMTLAEPGDGPARLRLCAFGYNCIRKTFDCPYTHIPNDEGNSYYQDENVPTPKDEVDESDTQVTRKVFSKFIQKTSSSNTSQLPTSISFISTTSIASTITDDSSIDSSDHSPSITPPDSPSASYTYSSSPDSPASKRQQRKIKVKQQTGGVMKKTPQKNAKK